MPAAAIVGAGARRAGFTLMEMLASIVVLLILMGIIFQVTELATQSWKQTTQGTTTMQAARAAFERMTRNLSQAVLNPYYDYLDSSNRWPTNNNYTPPPAKIARQSELQYISGFYLVSSTTVPLISSANATQVSHAVFFQAPLGVTSSPTTYGELNGLLNACGYFVVYCQDPSRPTFLSTFSNAPANEYRYRLMEYLQPSDYFSPYFYDASPVGQTLDSGTKVPKWISGGLPSALNTAPSTGNVVVRPLASNIVALIIMPEAYTSGTGANGEANTTNVCTSVNLTTASSTYTYDSGYKTATFYTSGAQTGVQNPTANQLPPLVKVIMVAIDEPSAVKLAAAHPAATITSPPDLDQLASDSSPLFTNPANLFTVNGVEGDLQKFEDILNATPGNLVSNTVKLNYYVFQTDVIIRAAKWTSQ